jgi:hypothetical protein
MEQPIIYTYRVTNIGSADYGTGDLDLAASAGDADTGETTASGIGGRTYTITIRDFDRSGTGTDDLDFAATTADADAFIDERYSLNFDDASGSGGRDLLIGGAGHLDPSPLGVGSLADWQTNYGIGPTASEPSPLGTDDLALWQEQYGGGTASDSSGLFLI